MPNIVVLEIEAVFEFVAENPPTAMIAWGILFVILFVLLRPFSPSDANVLVGLAPWLVSAGVAIHVAWLVLRYLV